MTVVSDAIKAKCFDEALVGMIRLEEENAYLRETLVKALYKIALNSSTAHNFLTKDEWWIPVGELAEWAWEELLRLKEARRHPMPCFTWYQLESAHVQA